MLLPRRLLPVFDAYIAVERAAAVAKFAQRRGWEAIDRPIFIHSPSFGQRSEEHTSELQSLMRISYAVFCLKKKKNKTTQKTKKPTPQTSEHNAIAQDIYTLYTS